jgi:HK97 family phage major capsid protein
MAVLNTSGLSVPTQLIDPWLRNVSEGSVVSQLSQAVPMKFGAGEAFVFDIGEAEYVGEGQNKGASTITSSVQRVEPYKFHKTVRWTEEVLWADEDYQLGVIQEILQQIQPALSRALDFGVLHGVNPATGTRPAAMAQALTDTTNVVSTGSGVALLDAADALVLTSGNVPSDIALAPGFAGQFATLRDDAGRRLFPDLNLGAGISSLEGHRAATSRTVSADGVIAGGSGIGAFVGDFSTVRWGIQKSIPLELIRYGDPDGQGDLKRNNQVAFRAEVVYGWGIADIDAVAKITVAGA